MVHTESKESPLWLPTSGFTDGSYRFEVQLVDEITGKTIDRLAGFFSVRSGQIVMPDGQDGKKLQSSLPNLTDILRRFAGTMLDFVVPQAEAADLIITDASPEIVFDDTDVGSDWRIFTNHLAIGGTVSIWRLFKGGSTEVIDIQAEEATQANLFGSLVINPAGDLQFAGGGMFFDRANVRLGIGLATPAHKLDIVGDRLRVRSSTAAAAKTIMLETDGAATDLEVQNSDLWIRADSPGPAHNICMLSNRVGVGTIGPESKLHVQGRPPQLVVANDAGNVRMDLRRSRARGSSQLLFGTGPVATGKNEFQVGVLNNSVFQIRSSGNSRKSITLEPTLGNVGIGTAAPREKLHVRGTVLATAFETTSDARLKENVTPITGALGKVMQVEGVSFTWKREAGNQMESPGGTHYGVVAQQVEKVLPEVVRNKDEMAVSYTELVPVLIEAIKEQQGIIAEQQKSIAELRERLTTVEMESGWKASVAATARF
jgi:hypothetical protein